MKFPIFCCPFPVQLQSSSALISGHLYLVSRVDLFSFRRELVEWTSPYRVHRNFLSIQIKSYGNHCHGPSIEEGIVDISNWLDLRQNWNYSWKSGESCRSQDTVTLSTFVVLETFLSREIYTKYLLQRWDQEVSSSSVVLSYYKLCLPGKKTQKFWKISSPSSQDTNHQQFRFLA